VLRLGLSKPAALMTSGRHSSIADSNSCLDEGIIDPLLERGEHGTWLSWEVGDPDLGDLGRTGQPA